MIISVYFDARTLFMRKKWLPLQYLSHWQCHALKKVSFKCLRSNGASLGENVSLCSGIVTPQQLHWYTLNINIDTSKHLTQRTWWSIFFIVMGVIDGYGLGSLFFKWFIIRLGTLQSWVNTFCIFLSLLTPSSGVKRNLLKRNKKGIWATRSYLVIK